MVTREEGKSIGDENFVDECSIIIHQDSISNSQEISENGYIHWRREEGTLSHCRNQKFKRSQKCIARLNQT